MAQYLSSNFYSTSLPSSFTTEELTVSNLRLHEIAIPMNRYEEVNINFFKYLTRVDISLQKVLTEINWISLAPEGDEQTLLRVKDSYLAVDITDKIKLRNDEGMWMGKMVIKVSNEGDPNEYREILTAWDPNYWNPQSNSGLYDQKTSNRGLLLIYKNQSSNEFINVGILTMTKFRTWAYEVLYFISNGNYPSSDMEVENLNLPR